MRIWLTIFMLTAALVTIPIYRRTITALPAIIEGFHQLPLISSRIHTRFSSTTRPQSETGHMASVTDSNMNPMPVLSQAGAPREEDVADALPKLSAADFRAYNRLAVMMDAYVSISDSPPHYDALLYESD